MRSYKISFFIFLVLLLNSFYGFNQNSLIKSISLSDPDSTIYYDPATVTLEIRIEMFSISTWQNDPPSDIAFFSLQNDYTWESRPVIFQPPVNPIYLCHSSPYVFSEDTNIVHFWLRDASHNIDTTASYTFVYNRPQIDLLSVQPADSVSGTRNYMVYVSNPELTVKAFSLFPSPIPSSFIKRIELINAANPSFIYTDTSWIDTSGVSQITVNFNLPDVFTLSAGQTYDFILRSVGKTAPSYAGLTEFSEEFPFSLTYMALDVPDTVCQVNSNVSLTGNPAGGSFYGNGIVNNTELFNPSLAQANAYNTITYRYIMDGEEFSVTKDIFVIDPPVINLDGTFEVCANSTDVYYEITNADTDKYDYIWTFNGVQEILDSTAVSTTVHWKSDPSSYTGKVFISLESKNPSQFCPAVFEYIVDIDPDPAPDKPCICFGDVSRRLLLCSNTEASFYKWYIDDGTLIGESNTPYFYLTDEIIKYNNITNSTVFTIQIAHQETGCYTTGYMCSEEMCSTIQAENFPQLIPEKKASLEVLSVTNPVSTGLDLQTSGDYSGAFSFEMYDMTGIKVFSNELTRISVDEMFHVDFPSALKPGIYLGTCMYNGNRTTPFKLIVY